MLRHGSKFGRKNKEVIAALLSQRNVSFKGFDPEQRHLFSHDSSTIESDRHGWSDGAEISCPFRDLFLFACVTGRLRRLSASSLAICGARPDSIPELLRSLPSV
jgi:hypothetical protein